MATSLFFLWSLLNVFLTFNVFRPLSSRTHGAWTFVMFGLGWLVGDLAYHWIALNLGLTLIFYEFGALESDSGQIGLILCAASWIALVMRWQGLSQYLPKLVQQQMAMALGSDYESRIAPELRARLTRGPFDWKAYWNPFRLYQDPEIEFIEDVVFYQEHDVRLKLDIYRPRQGTQNCPVLLQIHGGAWVFGTKNQAVPLMVRLAKQGWICFSITYRLSPKAVFPEHLIDCKRAVQWIKTEGARYGADPDCLFVTGGSAGGHLASLMALTPNRPEFQPGFETVDTQFQGCVAYYGIYDFESPFGITDAYPATAQLLEKMVMRSTPATQPLAYRQASPIQWAAKNTTPVLLIQGESDALIQSQEAPRFHEALAQGGTPHLAFLRLPLVEHAFDVLPTIPTYCVLPAVERYLALLLTEYRKKHLLSSTQNPA